MYWTQEERHPYILKYDGKLAGFVLERFNEDGMNEIAEFFVLNKYRKHGAGTFMANEMLKKYNVETIESCIEHGASKEQAEEDTLRNFLTNTDYVANKIAEAIFLNEETQDYTETLQMRKYARGRIDEIMKDKKINKVDGEII